MLESEIQTDPGCNRVRAMIGQFTREALDTHRTNEQGALLVGLCCTHYQYAAQSFAEVISDISGKKVVLVDPNERLSTFIFDEANRQRFKETKIQVEVVSQAKLKANDIKTISKIIHTVSPEFAQALINYKLVKTLFQF